ncbi:DUF3460 family protein [Duganella sp. P38]|uniref:DUF3460 family protein n=1 Tax=Duganella sp. P38 TaxID=3423949 RepID=UPI003D7ACE01
MKSQHYVSEFEQFMDSFLHQHPEVERDQVRAWRRWWTIPVRPGVDNRQDEVPRSPYYYD